MKPILRPQLKECWLIGGPGGWFESWLGRMDNEDAKKAAVKDQRLLNGIEAQIAVASSPSEMWISTKRLPNKRSCCCRLN